MRHFAAIAVTILCALPLASQQSQRHPAGTDAAGNQLTVIEKHFPERPAGSKRCVLKEQYVLETSRAGKVVSSEPVVNRCQSDTDEADITVTVAKNSIEIDRNGGAHAGYYLNETIQLAPWREVTAEACSFSMGTPEYTVEQFDLRTMRGQAWAGNSAETKEICGKGEDVTTYLLAPAMTVDLKAMEASRTGLGSCAMKLDASGKNGFITWGRPDPRDPVDVRLLWTGGHHLLVQVIDPGRSTKPATSWINADHLEIWMWKRGEDAPDGTPWQFGIPIDDGPVQVGYGKPKQLPVVRRWTAALPDGRNATLLAVELPPWPVDYASGVAIVYSQSQDGRAQKRLVATSRIKRGDSMSLGDQGTGMIGAVAGNYVTCSPVKGLLEITGGGRKPVVISPPDPDSK